ncbi:hypothetical protein XBJ2_1150002 [Xenorhabdus bovienii str. Jollieti]|nr:hypothetical protein XBJ2_1150002 [Xenorhabdus bovienii str. Jollieti]
MKLTVSRCVQGEGLDTTEISDFNWVIAPIDGARKFSFFHIITLEC